LDVIFSEKRAERMKDYYSILLGFCLTVFLTVGSTNAAAQSKNPDAVASANAAENAAIRKAWEAWNGPCKPFRIIGNIYYVGPMGVSSFLITTPAGHILIDTGFESTVPRIRDSIGKLGFKERDIRIILNSHAHLDHSGGDAAMKDLTGAKIMMSAADADLLASGGTNDFTRFSTAMKRYPPARADRLLRDGDKVTLGGSTLTCHLTPGHTKGCTTWTMDVTEEGKVYHVLFFGSTSLLLGVNLVNNPKYPNIVEDYTATYQKLKSLPCDVFLAPHAGFFGLADKAARLERGEKPNPFIDPPAFRGCIDQAERTFLDQLKKEQQTQAVKRD
jgi:metallo-beta-lactamase class B